MSTITVKPMFKVDGCVVDDNSFAHHVLAGFFLQNNFKTLLARTVEFKSIDELNLEQIQGMFHKYLSEELMAERIAHDLMGEFMATYDSLSIDHLRISHDGDNDTISFGINVTTKPASEEQREERRALSFGWFPGEYGDFDEENEE